MSKRKEKQQLSEPSMGFEEIKKKITDPWISMRTGIKVIFVVSILMVIWVVWQGNSSVPIFERIGWGLAFGASIWIIAIGFYLFNRYIIRR